MTLIVLSWQDNDNDENYDEDEDETSSILSSDENSTEILEKVEENVDEEDAGVEEVNKTDRKSDTPGSYYLSTYNKRVVSRRS